MTMKIVPVTMLGTDWQDPNRALQIQLALHLPHLTG
jgi:hypothetical protein